MNRRERKAMEKKLGLDKYKKGLSRAARFDMMSQNIEEGRKRQSQMADARKVQDTKTADEASSARISSIATDLMINKGMDWVSAQDKAVELYKEEIESLSNRE
jgi:hypothetical protein